MELLKNRPLTTICILSILIMAASVKLPYDSFTIVFILLAALFVATTILAVIFYFKKMSKPCKISICTAIFMIITSILVFRGFSFYIEKFHSVEHVKGEEAVIEGEVVDIGYKRQYNELLSIKICKINGNETDVDAVLYIEGESELEIGDIFTLKAVGEGFEPDEKYLISDGNVIKFECTDLESIEIISQTEPGIFDWFKQLNKNIQKRIYKLTDRESGALIGALTLGNRGEISTTVTRDFNRCGITHILSLSGLHMTIIVGFIDFILRKLRIDKKFRCFMLIFISLVYLALTGFSISAIRSVLMIFMVYIGYLLWEDSDSITSLAVAVVVILAISPNALSDVSLWLSAFSTLGIIVASEILSPLGYKIRKKSIIVKFLYKLLVSVSFSITAIFFVMIFNWLYFGEISIVAPISNLITAPLITAIIALGLVIIGLSPFIYPLAEVIGSVTSFLCGLVYNISSYVSGLRGITISLKYDFVPYIIIPLCISIVLFLILKIEKKWLVSLIPFASVVAFAISLSVYLNDNQGITKATYIREKSGEMIVITNNEMTTICDISSGGYKYFSESVKVAADNYSTEIENIVLTHYHNYHTNSLFRISQKYMVRNIYLPEPMNEAEQKYYDSIINIMKDIDVNVVAYKCGHKLYLGEGSFLNISEGKYIKRSTHPMFLISIRAEKESSSNELLYYTSAIFEDEEPDYPTNPDYFIIGAHGPRIHEAPNILILERSKPVSVLLADGEGMLSSPEIKESLTSLNRNGTKIIIDNHKYEFIIKN